MSDAGAGTALEPKAEFWRFLEDGEIRFQHCRDCGAVRWPARSVCWSCLSFEATWELAAAEGTVLSYAVVHRTYVPGRHVPFTLVHAELDDGVRYTGKLSAATDERLAVGSRVGLVLDDSGEEPEPKFELLEGGAA